MHVVRTLALLAVAAALCPVALAADITFTRGTATIVTGQRKVAVRVEIAETDAQRARGLMFRRSLAPNAGMLFLFQSATRGAFWMKDTHIPLSIAFADRRGRILKIMNMAPCHADPCPVYDPKIAYRRALEVNQGAFRRWRVKAGSRITLRRAP
jgi:uncharacterized membrane protein (UPF0127 family)